MNEPKVTTFFYGSYINRDVLREEGLQPEPFEVARLLGYDISIRPLANLVASDEHTVYGVLASATHPELERLYRHARDVLGGVYLPHPVLAYTLLGQAEPTSRTSRRRSSLLRRTPPRSGASSSQRVSTVSPPGI